jgi:hypothetical protein
VVLVLVIIGTLTSDPKPDTTAGQAPTTAPTTAAPATESATTDTVAPETTSKPATTAKPTTTRKPGPRVLFSQSSGGSHSLRPFTAPDSWRLIWSYDCRNFGTGNFIVSDESFNANIAINELDKGGHGTEYIDGGGRIKLQVITTCSRWTLKAVAP